MYNFDIRKHLLEYDNVMNKQREVIYDERRKILEGDDEYIKVHISEIIEEVLDSGFDLYLNENVSQQDGWDFDGFGKWLERKFGSKMGTVPNPNNQQSLKGLSPFLKDRTSIREGLLKEIAKIYSEKEKQLGTENLRHLERFIMLQVVDSQWKDHLYAMDSLREGIGLRAVGQKDPLVEYQHEGYDMFMDMTDNIKEEVVEFVFRVEALREEKVRSVFGAVPQRFEHPDAARLPVFNIGDRFSGIPTQKHKPVPTVFNDIPTQEHKPVPNEPPQQYKRQLPKVGRNDPCPCGSGKKYKKCCGLDS